MNKQIYFQSCTAENVFVAVQLLHTVLRIVFKDTRQEYCEIYKYFAWNFVNLILDNQRKM